MTTDVRPLTAPIEVVTPIRPSEAIRLGCLTTVQNFGLTSADNGHRVCAIGAMQIGLGTDDYGTFAAARDSTPTTCPVDPTHQYNERGEGIGWSDFAGPTAIAHLNDDHRWSRERIADWLESLGL